jgi:hypothetical protein
MLTQHELIGKLPPGLDEKIKERFIVAYRSIGYQDQYCRYHYEKFKEELVFFNKAYSGDTQEFNAQYYRIAFEANAFAFFRTLHSLIDSVPYLLNIILGIKVDVENDKLNWNTIKGHVDGRNKILINELISSGSYRELRHLVNISKHRRIPRVDSGIFQDNERPRLWKADLDIEFRFYELEILMEEFYNELFLRVINIIISTVADI